MQSMFIAEHLEGLAATGASMGIHELSLELCARCAMDGLSKRDPAACELYCKRLLRQGQVLKGGELFLSLQLIVVWCHFL